MSSHYVFDPWEEVWVNREKGYEPPPTLPKKGSKFGQ
jgi:hypothetical protein